MPDLIPIQRALLSASDKSGLLPLARKLHALGVELISTGGTRRTLEQAGLPVIGIEQVTGFPEMMGGRVKTLHPNVHGALLALRDDPEHQATIEQHGIRPIDLVCVNLYPFEQTVAQENVRDEQAIEQIDIGGPSMIRSAAKNHAFVAVVTDPAQYSQLIASLDQHDGATPMELRRELAGAAFARTASYDAAITRWLSKDSAEEFPQSMTLRLDRAAQLRYGENPHQGGALYVDPAAREPSVARARQHHGKELSFNNLYDANGALELVKEVDASEAACAAVIKHANPCGFAVAETPAAAFEKAWAGDPLAAFGGIVAFNRALDLPAAQALTEGKKFLEVILAPGYDADALDALRERWKNVRILETGPLPAPADRDPREHELKRLVGGMLVQQRDLAPLDPEQWAHKGGPPPPADRMRQMRLGMIAVKHLKSNAVCLVRDDALVGAGAGQMDRVASCRIAVEKAGERAEGAIAASDAFFPFRDGPDQLISAGVKGIVQPGGSKRDEETVAACEENGIPLLFTGRRHFRH